MYIYFNGQFVKKEEVKISPFDHGFLYGMGLFETFRVYERHPFLLDDHLERLNQGLELLNINFHFDREELYSNLQELLEINNLTNAYIRLNVSAGIGDIGLQVEPYMEPNILIFPKPLPPAGELAEKKTVLLKLRRNSPEGKERIKSHHFMNNILAKREIGNAADVEGVFLTKDGYLAEGIVSNIFWLKGNVLFTPAVQTGILNGITRQFVIELGKKNNLSVAEGYYTVEHALQADELFVTNSIQEIVPITSFEGLRLPGKKGPIVQQLHHDYRNYCKSLWSRHGLGE
ncbi:aminodeoxychorismate lyase [Neobacillus drentensis]|uniref:aminodeoxychorismate lyase n=1 Tax=Neobacillus drentensis TaxID=220684 RepID=UPI0028605EC5|nr:aminodeoxychorismate lyase [Neobacillus drentensis]MDR7236012.1 4-amino-4-deoxychorismate lyase [Neobacillus drentensis]